MPARGTPSHIRSDNGPEVAALAERKRLGTRGVDTACIEPGGPWENGCVESFDSKLPGDGAFLHDRDAEHGVGGNAVGDPGAEDERAVESVGRLARPDDLLHALGDGVPQRSWSCS